MTITASTAQIGGTPVQSGSRTLKTTPNITASSPTGTAVDVTGDDVALTLINTGTLDNAASLALQAQINGSSFFPVLVNGTAKTWTGTQINAGVCETVRVKAAQIRLVLTPGTTTGTNGVIARVLD